MAPCIRRLTNKQLLYSSASIPFNRNNLVIDVLGFVALEVLARISEKRRNAVFMGKHLK